MKSRPSENNNSIGTILLSALVGTSAMTLFSYVMSHVENRNYREPEVLGRLIKRLPASGSKASAQIAGWCAHYAIGILFVTFYNRVLKQQKLSPSLTSGILLGGTSGLTGILAWKGMFEVHPNPQSKNLKAYFSHLMLAHVVFGVCSALTYKLAREKQNQAHIICPDKAVREHRQG